MCSAIGWNACVGVNSNGNISPAVPCPDFDQKKYNRLPAVHSIIENITNIGLLFHIF